MMGQTRRLKRLLRGLQKAARQFRDRGNEAKQVAWAAKARSVRGEVESMLPDLEANECQAAGHVLLALESVAGNVMFGRSSDEEEQFEAAWRLLNGKAEVET